MLVSTALSSSTRRLPASLPLLTTAATFSPSMHRLRAVLLLTTTAALAPAPKPLITPCAWQLDNCAREHALVREWYDKGRDQSRYGVGNWGVSYRQYVDGFVAAVADELNLKDGDAVFESAVGEGWFLRGLAERLPTISLRAAGNDVLESALEVARRDVPGGVFCVGDSKNLTWVPAATFDAAVCAYVEVGTAATPEAEADAYGSWTRELARTVKPGGRIFVGNVQAPRATEDAAAGLYLKPPAAAGGRDVVDEAWWRDAAASDEYGWDAEDVRVAPLTDATLLDAWGPRYHVFMRRRRKKAERKWPSWQDEFPSGGL